MDVLFLLPIGLLAGAITTFAGVGGGLVLTLVLAAVWDPQTALAVAAPALLFGNAHRVFTHRKHVDLTIARAAILGAVPGGLIGGFLAVSLPNTVLQWLLVLVVVLALMRELNVFSWRPSARALTPITGLAGIVTATSGGGGLILGPLLLTTGLRGAKFIATGSSIAFAIHVSRIAAYGAGGLMSEATLLSSAALTLTIVLGNIAGRRVREKVSTKTQTATTYAVLIGGVALSVLGLT